MATGFEKGLHEKGPKRFNQPRTVIPGIPEALSGLDDMAGLVKDGAIDRICGGDRLQNRFNAATEDSFIRPYARAEESLIADYETFEAKMMAESSVFSEELSAAQAELPEADRAIFPDESLQARMAQTYDAFKGVSFNAGHVAVETAIEAATIRGIGARRAA